MTKIEKQIYDWIINEAANFEDGETGLSACLDFVRIKYRLPEDVIEWAANEYTVDAALSAGIPMSVIKGESKLSDFFSREYVEMQKRGK